MAIVTAVAATAPTEWKIPVSASFVSQIQSWDFNEADFGFHYPQPIKVGHLVQFVSSTSESPILQVVGREWREPEGNLFWTAKYSA